ncbi:MAG: hypothetical protein K9N05_01600 [Candidatus Marinimicrobia bacterium]|nr:hypothetical protein [Candidatus Neomarinimicrobiota bacterium]
MKHNRERIRWVFQRITGLQLLICFGIHIWVFFFKLERPITLSGLQLIFSRPEWIVFYTIFIALAVYHGFLGLWTVLTDENPSKTYKKVWKIILFISGGFLVGISVWNIILLGVQ